MKNGKNFIITSKIFKIWQMILQMNKIIKKKEKKCMKRDKYPIQKKLIFGLNLL